MTQSLSKSAPRFTGRLAEITGRASQGADRGICTPARTSFLCAQDSRSLKYDMLAGEKAARLYANAEAATHFSRALEVARRNGSDLAQINIFFLSWAGCWSLRAATNRRWQNYNDLQEFGRTAETAPSKWPR